MLSAEEHLLKELIDAVLLENLFSIQQKGKVSYEHVLSVNEGEVLFEVPLLKGEALVIPVRLSALQTYRLSRSVVYVRSDEGLQEIGFLETAMRLLETYGMESGYTEESVNQWMEEMKLALDQTALSFERDEWSLNHQTLSFLETERLAAFRDRPFHPTAKAKVGWNKEAYQLYSPEFQQEVKLSWVAVRRDYVQAGEQAKEDILYRLLTDEEKVRLREAFQKKGITEENYLALPVHPWQGANVIPTLYQKEIAKSICIPLDLELGAFTPTSSLRSLAPVSGGAYHVKLPIGIFSLGALRLMPIRYLRNGEKGQMLLEQLKDRDSYLTKHLYICDERNWWGFRDPDLFADKPGHLTCQVRSYPNELMDESQFTLVSMAALAAGEGDHLFSSWLTMRQEERNEENVISLFAQLSKAFVRLAFRFLFAGILPELHGQNVVLVIKAGELDGFLLRDHDTVRIYPKWMEKAGLHDPHYIIRTDTPNTLILQHLHEFIAYFQTLALEVNVYAIIDRLSAVYEVEEAVLWELVQRSVREALEEMKVDSNQREEITKLLFAHETWPVKRLLDPLLRRKGSGGGSMPSSLGEIKNPFQNWSQG